MVSPTPFINKQDSSRDLIIFMTSFTSSLEIKHFLWITASVADAATINPSDIKTRLANSLSTLPIKGNSVFSNVSKILPKNPPNSLILCNLVFDIFILTEQSFLKALPSFKACVLVNNNLCGGKLFSSLESPATFDEIYFIIIFYSRF